MKIYFPEIFGGEIRSVGYNNAISLLKYAGSEYFTNSSKESEYRMYCNLPWHHAPEELKENKKLVCYTMYESTKVPKGWIKFLNKHAYLVLVPSNWCLNVFVNSGLKRPIEVLPLGIREENTKLIDKTKWLQDYVYLWVGVAYEQKGMSRKGLDSVIEAFTNLRKTGALGLDTKLIIKYKMTQPQSCRDSIRNFSIDGVTTSTGIVHIQKDFTQDEMIELYNKVDCCVNPTHGEGFGFLPLEQMAIGKPVIVTNYSMDYLENAPCIKLRFTCKPSVVTWNHKFFALLIDRIVYNFGGLYNEIPLLPKLIKYKSDNIKRKAVALPFPDTTINEISYKNFCTNLLSDLQRKTGLFRKANRKALKLFQEFQGYDAHPNIIDLQRKMLWCYNNREEAKEIGIKSRQYVIDHWNINLIRPLFKKIIRKIESGVYNA